MKRMMIPSMLLLLTACGGSSTGTKESAADTKTEAPAVTTESPASDKGIGKFKDVALSPTLDTKMAEQGNKVFDVKCSACHRLSDERLVGPGWKGVTSRRRPEWIMNFVTNVDEMLTKDPAAQAQLEVCLVRMPNQNLTDDDARHVLEFMRRNDGVK